MFIDEAEVAAQLNHNNIIHIYDLGKIGDDYFIAMAVRRRQRTPTQQRSRREPSAAGPALVGSRVASALDHAHRQKGLRGRLLGLVHRDVSPQNVLISFEGDIAPRLRHRQGGHQGPRKPDGRPSRASSSTCRPSRFRGRPVDAFRTSSALGSLLFEMLTGRRLFSGESEMSVLDAVREGRIQGAARFIPASAARGQRAGLKKALAPRSRRRSHRWRDAARDRRHFASLKPAPSQAGLGSTSISCLPRKPTRAPHRQPPCLPAPRRAARAARLSAAVPACPAEVASSHRRACRKSRRQMPDAAADVLARYRRCRGRRGPLICVTSPAAASWLAPPAPAAAKLRPRRDPGPGSCRHLASGRRNGRLRHRGPMTAAPGRRWAGVGQMVISDEVKRDAGRELQKKCRGTRLARRKTELDKLNKPAATPACRARDGADGDSRRRASTTQEAPPEPAPALVAARRSSRRRLPPHRRRQPSRHRPPRHRRFPTSGRRLVVQFPA